MPRFVILEHSWNGVHWDVMLEHDAILRTWSIDSPIVAGVILPARRLPDHRLAYLEYEGEISGGRGRVERVDRGSYRSLIWTDRQIRIELQGTRFTGKVDLVEQRDQREGETEIWVFRLGEGNLD